MKRRNSLRDVSSKQNPLVSVIIPAFNATHTILETLASVLHQTLGLDKLEVIIVNDGSTDETTAVSAGLLKTSNIRWRIIDTSHSGPSAARNAGLRIAQGEWIQFLDADDLIAPDKLAVQVGVPDHIAVVYSPWERMRRLNGQWVVNGRVYPSIVGELLVGLLKTENFIATGSQIFRRTWVENAEGFNERRHFIEDVELLLRLAISGAPFLRVGSTEPLFFYRQHSGSLSCSNRRAFVDGYVENAHLVEKHWRGKHESL